MDYPFKEENMDETNEALLEVIERLQRQLCDAHFALGKLTSESKRIREKYHKYWTTLSPDAVPRPDMLRDFQSDMGSLVEGTFNGK
jgi:hypothetical protein